VRRLWLDGTRRDSDVAQPVAGGIDMAKPRIGSDFPHWVDIGNDRYASWYGRDLVAIHWSVDRWQVEVWNDWMHGWEPLARVGADFDRASDLVPEIVTTATHPRIADVSQHAVRQTLRQAAPQRGR
jgi:hypothetical protein